MRVRGIDGLRVVDASVMRRAARQWRGALPPSRSSPPPPSPRVYVRHPPNSKIDGRNSQTAACRSRGPLLAIISSRVRDNCISVLGGTKGALAKWRGAGGDSGVLVSVISRPHVLVTSTGHAGRGERQPQRAHADDCHARRGLQLGSETRILGVSCCLNGVQQLYFARARIKIRRLWGDGFGKRAPRKRTPRMYEPRISSAAWHSSRRRTQRATSRMQARPS